LITRLATCQWVREHHNVLITGPTGIGNTWLGCALGHKARREGFTALYLRLPRFLQELPIVQGNGRYGKLMATLARIDLLILDDWGLAPFSDEHRRDLVEIIEDRHDCPATLVNSQLPVEHRHEALGDPTLADAIFDRLVHHAYKITLQGESMRKRQAKLMKWTRLFPVWLRYASMVAASSTTIHPEETSPMAQHMSVLGIDLATQVCHVVGMMTAGTWCSGSASRAVHGWPLWRMYHRSASGWTPVEVPMTGPDSFASMATTCG
jgi:hypothetical protein